MKEFSVLISVYAREQSDYLRSALHSVFEQTVPPTEVVLVEDGPLTTELEAVITDFCEKYNTLKIVKLAKNMGLGNALNILMIWLHVWIVMTYRYLTGLKLN